MAKADKNNKSSKKQTYQKGALAEWMARLFLMIKGYHILAHRHRTPVGEIDLICQKGRQLIFIEVKYRKSIEDSIHSLAYWQRRRIERSALYFMQGKGFMADNVRFDLIALAPWRIPRHIPNAWQQA